MEHHVHGETYRAEWDYDRLKNNRQRVLYTLLDGKAHHIPALRKIGGDAADMRVRELRSDWCGTMKVDEWREPGGLSYYHLDLASVDDYWVRRVLNGEVRRPKKKDLLPDNPNEMLELLREAIEELVALDNIKHAKNIYRSIQEEIHRRKTPAPGSGAPGGHPDLEPEEDSETVFDLACEPVVEPVVVGPKVEPVVEFGFNLEPVAKSEPDPELELDIAKILESL